MISKKEIKKFLQEEIETMDQRADCKPYKCEEK